MKNDDFKKAEKRERACIKWLRDNRPNDFHYLGISDIEAFEPYDAIGFTKLENVGFRLAYIEVKIREVEDTTYPTAYLEKQKVDRLIEIMKSEDKLPDSSLHYYAVYPKSKKIYVFDILSSPHTIVLNVPCPDTTCNTKKTVLKDMLSYSLDNPIKVIDI